MTLERDDGIDIIELAAAIWRRKTMISALVLLFGSVGAIYAFVAPPRYKSEVLLAATEREQGMNVPAGLGGLASLAGLTLGSTADSTESIAALRSRAFVEEFIADNNLLPVLFADEWDAANQRWKDDDPHDWPDIREGVEYFIEHVRTINEDVRTGLITLGVEWLDPQLSADWADALVHRINERLRARDLANSERKLAYLHTELEQASLVELRQAISRLIENEIQTMTLAHAEAEYAFKVIDPARVPRERSSPKRALVIALSALSGAFVGILMAITGLVVSKRRALSAQDPAA
jgi:uncharacterized protein involved in exopolysaccharide biosynthesis